MPVRESIDDIGNFFQWGNSGKKYYFNPSNSKDREAARLLSKKQGQAIKISQLRRARQR